MSIEHSSNNENELRSNVALRMGIRQTEWSYACDIADGQPPSHKYCDNRNA